MSGEPRQNQARWKWSRPKHKAVQLLAADELTDQEIADKLEIQRDTLWRWKNRPEFATKLEQARKNLGALAERYALGRRARRLQALDDREERMRRVIEERAADPAHADVPGFRSGLLVHTVKGVGKGDDFKLVDLYEVDTGLLRELREHEKQAAQEVGQWVDKSEIGATAQLQIDEIVDASPEESRPPAPGSA